MKRSSNISKLVISALILVLATSCGRKNKEDTVGYLNESSLTEEVSKSIGSALDANESNSSNSAKMSSSDLEAKGLNSNYLFGNQCNMQVLSASCSIDSNDGSSVRRSELTNCSVETPRFGVTLQLSGFSQLKYSSTSCLLDSVGDKVTRTYDLQYTNSNNATAHIRSTSETFSDPITGESVTVGGGAELTHENNGWSLNILGRNITFTRASGNKAIDLSIKTTSPIVGHGYRYDGSRVVESGTIEVYHKLAKSKVTHRIHNLQYTTQCCHPTGGSIDLDYQGTSEAWSGTITFGGCGTAQLLKAGAMNAENLELKACE